MQRHLQIVILVIFPQPQRSQGENRPVRANLSRNRQWVGEGPDGQGAQVVNAAARNSFSSNGFERSIAIDMLTAGSGELGAHGARPGGAPTGFYVQLKWMDSWVQQEQNRHIADRQAGMNAPVWDTITDLLDPLIGMGYYQQMADWKTDPVPPRWLR